MTQDDVIHVICCLGCLFTSLPLSFGLTACSLSHHHPTGPLLTIEFPPEVMERSRRRSGGAGYMASRPLSFATSVGS